MTDGIAIVGLGCIFPGAGDVDAYWSNICNGVDAISSVPAERWHPSHADERALGLRGLYCKRGGFIDQVATFQPTAFGVMPVAARAAEPDQLLCLKVASAALQDAGYGAGDSRLRHAGVVLGRGGYGTSGQARMEQATRGHVQLRSALRDLIPELTEEELARVSGVYGEAIRAPVAELTIGLIPNLAASRIAHAFDMRGPALTLDAACASSLLAVEHASDVLKSGRCDLMLCGGVHVCHTEPFWSVFAELGALSRAAVIRPFDERADGLLLGEGVGIVVLKRELDALRDGDRIYAVIRGVGSASDGKAAGFVSPSSDGQQLALAEAWNQTELDPQDLALLEAHGTGTPLGDRTELETVARFFAHSKGAIGSVKSMIGHTMPAAGAASLIKAALAVHHAILPPTLNCEHPRAELMQTSLRPLPRAQPWDELRRIAGVNAFGFGGINAHVVLESSAAVPRARRRPIVRESGRPEPLPSVTFFAASTRELLLERVRGGRGGGEGSQRLALVDPTPERRDRAARLLQRGTPFNAQGIGIHYSAGGLLEREGRLAFVFPGLDAELEADVRSVISHFDMPRPEHSANGVVASALRVLDANSILAAALRRLDVIADVHAGHSLGEWSALVASGVVDEATSASLTRGFTASLQSDAVRSLALTCAAEAAHSLADGLDGIAFTHYNCPKQTIVCGTADDLRTLTSRARDQRILTREVALGTGVHSRYFAAQLSAFEQMAQQVAYARAQTPLYSATTGRPYPDDADALRRLAIAHLMEPVRFQALVERLYADGVRIFVQVGAGRLPSFVRETLGTRPHLSISASEPHADGLVQLLRVACALWSAGRSVNFAPLLDPAKSRAELLDLGVRLVRFQPLSREARRGSDQPASREPVPEHLQSIGDALAESQRELSRALAAVPKLKLIHPSARVPDERRPARATFTQRLGIETFPELIDHSFYRQAPDWPDLRDRHPVVPMSGLIELMRSAANRLLDAGDAAEVTNVVARRWLAVAEPIEARFLCQRRGDGTIAVEIDGYASCEVRPLAAAGPLLEPWVDGKPIGDISATEVYADHWMFHGPAYQGIAALDRIGPTGISGELCCGPALGSIVDSAAQLLGVWAICTLPHDQLAMPVRARRARFYGAAPPPHARLESRATVKRVTDSSIVADLVIAREGRIWARVDDWEIRRLQVDERLWSLMTWPEKRMLSRMEHDGWFRFEDDYRSALTRDYLMSRYVAHRERSTIAASDPVEQRRWLNRRIAAKDALRSALWGRGAPPLFPTELALNETSPSQLQVSSRWAAGWQVEIRQQGNVTEALARAPGD